MTTQDIDDVLDMDDVAVAHQLERIHRVLSEDAHKNAPHTPESLLEHARNIKAINRAIDLAMGKKK